MKFNIVQTIACLQWQANTPKKKAEFNAMRRRIMTKKKGGGNNGI